MEIRLIIDDRIVSFFEACGRTVSRRRLAMVVGGGLLCSSGLVSADTVTKAYTFSAGQPIVASQVNENFDQLFDAVNERVVRANTTIDVADCAELSSALIGLAEKTILPTATVTIRVAVGTHECAQTLRPIHPNGPQIVISGATTTATDTVLTFPPDPEGGPYNHGIDLAKSDWGKVTNLTLIGASGSMGTGVRASMGAHVDLDNVKIADFARGVDADLGAVVRAVGVAVTGSTSYGFIAESSSAINAAGCSVNMASGTGFRAMGSAYLSATEAVNGTERTRCRCTGSGSYAVTAYLGGAVSLNGVDIDGSYAKSIVYTSVNSVINAGLGSIATSATWGGSSTDGALTARYHGYLRYKESEFVVSAQAAAATYAPGAEASIVLAY